MDGEAGAWLQAPIERLVARFPTQVILVFLIAAAAAIVPATFIVIDPGFEALMLRNDPDLLSNNTMKAEFSNDEAFVVAVDFHHPFDERDLRFLHALSREITAIDGVEEVFDLTTIEDVRGWDAMLDASPLVDFAKLPADLARIRTRAVGHRLYQRNLVSPDAHVLTLIAIPDYRPERRSLGIEVVSEVVPLLETARQRCDNCDVYLSGYATSVWDANRILQRDFAALGLLALGVVMLLNYLLYGRWFAAVVTGIVVLWAQVITAAWFGSTGTAITIPSGLVTPMVSAIASTYAIYALGMLHATSQEREPGTALVGHLLRPTVLSSLSTAAGFLSLNLMPVEGITDLGNALAVGVGAAALASMVLVPALINRFGWRLDTTLPLPALERGALIGVRLARRPTRTIVVAAAVVVAVGAGVRHLEIETDTLAHWDPDSTFRVAQDFTNDRVGGSQTMNIIVRTGQAGAALEPAVLAYANSLNQRLEASPTIARTVSFLDYVYLMDLALNPEHEPRTVLPDRETAAQYMLLYESGGNPDDFRHYINFDRSALNLYGRLADINSSRVLELRDEILTYARHHAPAGVSTEVVGTQVLTDKAHEGVAHGMIRGLLAATVAIFLMLALTLRSVPLALLAMIPNVIPIVICGGLAGWLGHTVSISTSIVGCIALGLAVDDTAHVLGHLDPRSSLRDVYARIGRPVIVTTLSLGAGFLTLGLSEFAAVRTTGIATALTLFAALAADVVLLPSLLTVAGWQGYIRTGAADHTGTVSS